MKNQKNKRQLIITLILVLALAGYLVYAFTRPGGYSLDLTTILLAVAALAYLLLYLTSGRRATPKEDPDVLLDAALAIEDHGERIRRLTELRDAGQLPLDDSYLYIYLSISYFQMQDEANALRYITMAIAECRRAPQRLHELLYLSWLYKVQYHITWRQYDTARDAYRQMRAEIDGLTKIQAPDHSNDYHVIEAQFALHQRNLISAHTYINSIKKTEAESYWVLLLEAELELLENHREVAREKLDKILASCNFALITQRAKDLSAL